MIVQALLGGIASEAIVDCWNTAGIHGDRSCPELPKHTHCCNCPVYAAAARRILERRAGTDSDSNDHVSEAPASSLGPRNSIVVFRLGSEYFALPANSIQEISPECPAHSIPHRQSRLPIGLVNVQGELLITAALNVLLGTEASPKGETPRGRRHVVVACNGLRFAFLADDVCDILEHTSDQTVAAPPTLSSNFTRGLRQNGGRTIAILDPELIMGAVNREIA